MEWNDLHSSAQIINNPCEFLLVIEAVKEHYPCDMCRKNFNTLYSKYPPPRNGRMDDMRLWLSQTHNRVTRQRKGLIPTEWIEPTLEQLAKVYGTEHKSFLKGMLYNALVLK